MGAVGQVGRSEVESRRKLDVEIIREAGLDVPGLDLEVEYMAAAQAIGTHEMEVLSGDLDAFAVDREAKPDHAAVGLRDLEDYLHLQHFYKSALGRLLAGTRLCRDRP